MDKLSITAESLKNIEYGELRVSQSLNSVGKRHQIDVVFSLRGSLSINQPEPKQTFSSCELMFLNTSCEIKLVNETKEKRFILKPLGSTKLSLSEDIIFSILVDPKDIEELNTWVNGEFISVKWNLCGYILVLDVVQPILPISIYISNWTDNNKPKISYSQFISEFMKPLNLNSFFIDEFPLKISDNILSIEYNTISIKTLIIDLESLIKNLNNAVIKLRSANQNLDYLEVMNKVKSSLDIIRKYSKLENKDKVKDLGYELLIKTGVINKIDSQRGEDIAATEFMSDFCSILESLYQIASKPAHPITKGKDGKRFSMSPDRSEATFVTEIGLSAAKYLISRINIYVLMKLNQS